MFFFCLSNPGGDGLGVVAEHDGASHVSFRRAANVVVDWNPRNWPSWFSDPGGRLLWEGVEPLDLCM